MRNWFVRVLVWSLTQDLRSLGTCLSLENHCLKSKTQVKLVEGFMYRVKEFQAYGIEYFSLFS